MSWDWSTAGSKNTNGANMVIRDANGDPVYDTQKGTFTWAKNVRPEYVWFNGTVDYTLVDDVIEPQETRPRLIRALAMLRGKRGSLPPKKHGNIPL